MAKRPAPPQQPSAMTPDQMARGIATIRRRITDLEKFDPAVASEHDVNTLQTSIDESLERVFSRGSTDYARFSGAALLDNGPLSLDFMGRGAPRNTRGYLAEGKTAALALLTQAVRTLQERIEDAGAPAVGESTQLAVDSDRIFIVHGHDGEVKHDVARFLEILGLEPVILDEQANKGMTIIEKFEANSNVGFAVVLLTPDDVGAAKGASTKPRARQNVVLELGFFVGKLTRKRVYALVRGSDIELPSDIHGLVWARYEEDWKLKLARELKAAGYDIDMNKAV